jgi:predicted PurR-regulated permease PerM
MFGATIGCAITVLLLLLYEPITCLIFIGYYVVYQQIENNIISPRIQAKRLKMSPLVVLFALVVGFAAGGAIGGIVAIPCAGCVLVLVKELLAWRKQRRKIREGAS